MSAPFERVAFTLAGAEYERLLGRTDPRLRYAVLLAALGVCLHRFSGRTRVSLGASAAVPGGRPRVVPILLDVCGSVSFADLAARVSDLLRLGGSADCEALDEVIAELCLTAAPGVHPLFEVSGEMAGPDDDPAELPARVRLVYADSGSQLRTVVHFDPAVLDAGEAREVIRVYRQLLVAAAMEPDRTVAEITALSPPEYQRVVVDWNRTAQSWGSEYRVHRLVEAQVAAQPDAIAVVTERGSYRYRELDDAANRLAHHLRTELGVVPGDLVAVAMERSFDLIVCLLAVLKTGAAYLPLDPAHPLTRHRLTIEDARPVALLTLSRYAGGLSDMDIRIICVDADAGRIAGNPGTNPAAPCWPDSRLCVIYTSGTTGRPKGVMLTHRGAANSVLWERYAYQIEPKDRLLHLASCAFSLAILEIFSPLCAGAAVVVAPPAAAGDSAAIAGLVADTGVTLLSVVPAELELLLDEDSAMPWNAIRRVITGADILRREVHDRYLATCPSVPLLNIYGQTESALDALCWTCRPDDGLGRVPVGRPVANVRAYILDADMRPVPPGVPGVLYLGGAGLAQGYLNRPDLTAERFVPNPFASVPGERLSRTGDLARWQADGVIETLGREDHQVQVSGARVELEEIESILREHPGIRDAAVAMQSAPPPPEADASSDAGWIALLDRVDPQIVDRHLAAAESIARP